jgi:hypothetical protein
MSGEVCPSFSSFTGPCVKLILLLPIIW